jgi:hypothetical protein
MRGFVGIIVSILVLSLLGGCAYLMFANPAPAQKIVERDIPNDRLPN